MVILRMAGGLTRDLVRQEVEPHVVLAVDWFFYTAGEAAP